MAPSPPAVSGPAVPLTGGWSWGVLRVGLTAAAALLTAGLITLTTGRPFSLFTVGPGPMCW